MKPKLPKPWKNPGEHPLTAASIAVNAAGAQMRPASFEWENGRFTHPLKIGAVPKGLRPVCGAKCRDGHACRAKVCVRPDGSLAPRCRMHGGLSSSPTTSAGRAAIAASNSRRKGTRYCTSPCQKRNRADVLSPEERDETAFQDACRALLQALTSAGERPSPAELSAAVDGLLPKQRAYLKTATRRRLEKQRAAKAKRSQAAAEPGSESS